jgi:outer membrane protein
MEVRANLLVAVMALCLVAPVWAEESAPTATVPAQPIELLDQVPHSGQVLMRQLRGGVPAEVTAAERSTEHYGRLIDTQAPQALSLSDCIALALENNTDLKIQRLGPLAASNQVRGARALFDAALVGNVLRDRTSLPNGVITSSPLFGPASPILFRQDFVADVGLRKMLLSGGQLSLAWQNSRLTTNPSIANELVPQYMTSLALSLNQPLLRDFGWRYSLVLVQVAQNLEEEAYHQYRAAIATIITTVERAYWNFALAIEQVQVQEDGLVLATELLRQNESKVKVGTLPQTSLLEAQSEVARRETSLIRFRNQRNIARDNLRALINYPKPEAGPLVMVEPRDKPVVGAYQVDLNRSLQAALEQRPELIAARLEIHGRGLQRKAAENQLLPRLNVVGGIGVNGMAGSGALPPFVFSTGVGPPIEIGPNPGVIGGYSRALELLHDGRFYNYSVGAVVEVPLGNARAKADYVAANLGLEQSRLLLQRLEEGVTLEVKQAVSNLTTDLRSIDATRLARELAEENVRNQQARYDVGLVTTKDLLDFQDKLTQARADEVQALTTYSSDLAEMRRVEGSLLSARNVLVERASPEAAPWWARF